MSQVPHEVLVKALLDQLQQVSADVPGPGVANAPVSGLATNLTNIPANIQNVVEQCQMTTVTMILPLNITTGQNVYNVPGNARRVYLLIQNNSTTKNLNINVGNNGVYGQGIVIVPGGYLELTTAPWNNYGIASNAVNLNTSPPIVIVEGMV